MNSYFSYSAALAIALAVVIPSSVAAQGNTASTSGVAAALIVAPISLTHDAGTSLNFGSMTAGGGGTVIVDVDGSGTTSGEVTLLTGVATSADMFTVEGDPNRSFDIVTTGGSLSDGANSMSFTTSAASSGTLDGGGSMAFAVGGTLTVAADQAGGSYTGTYQATVTYN